MFCRLEATSFRHKRIFLRDEHTLLPRKATFLPDEQTVLRKQDTFLGNEQPLLHHQDTLLCLKVTFLSSKVTFLSDEEALLRRNPTHKHQRLNRRRTYRCHLVGLQRRVSVVRVCPAISHFPDKHDPSFFEMKIRSFPSSNEP